MKIFIGNINSIEAEKIISAYEQGCNSLFVSRDRSFHDAQSYVYAQKRTKGRQVRNPLAWIEKAKETETINQIALWRVARGKE